MQLGRLVGSYTGSKPPLPRNKSEKGDTMEKSQEIEVTFSITCSCGQVMEKKPVESSTEYFVECEKCGLVVEFETGSFHSLSRELVSLFNSAKGV